MIYNAFAFRGIETYWTQSVRTIYNVQFFIPLLGRWYSLLVRLVNQKTPTPVGHVFPGVCMSPIQCKYIESFINFRNISFIVVETCQNFNTNCDYWANEGYCNSFYSNFMNRTCGLACNTCQQSQPGK